MAGGDWRWRLKRADDQVVASGEGYPTRSECERAVAKLKQDVEAAPVSIV